MHARHKGLYWAVLVLAIALTVLYADRRSLIARYVEHDRGVAQVIEGRQQCEMLENDVAQSRQQVDQLGNDPVEMEAAIRHNKDLVREGETVYRIEQVPEGPH